MIEIRRRNTHGIIQFIEVLSEEDFVYQYYEKFIIDNFSNDDVESTRRIEYIDEYERVINEFKYVAYNEKGKLLTVEYLIGLIRTYHAAWEANGYRHTWRGWVKRSQVQWNPWAKHKNIRFYRHPKTTQERRWAHAWEDEEYPIKPRGRRSAHNLPESWDDYWRKDMCIRNWKRYRKHQWKVKK